MWHVCVSHRRRNFSAFQTSRFHGVAVAGEFLFYQGSSRFAVVLRTEALGVLEHFVQLASQLKSLLTEMFSRHIYMLNLSVATFHNVCQVV
jgi:hypothetical protein